MNEDTINNIAKEIFLYACKYRADNKTHQVEEVTSGWDDMHPCSQHFYKTIAKWHLENSQKLG